MKILVVEDHSLFRDALRGALLELRPEATIFNASTCIEAARLAREHGDIALILLDLSLPDGDGLTVLGELRLNYPATAVVVMSARKDRETITKALDAGAVGFIPKSATREVTLSALGLVFAGGIFIPPEALGMPIAPIENDLMSMRSSSSPSPGELGLTVRQLEVIALMVHGMSNKAICRRLNVAEATVKNHVTAVLRALRVSNRTEAVIAIRDLGWQLPPVAS